MSKMLEPNSEYASLDADGDGVVSDEELSLHERFLKIENEDKKEDQIRLMAWFALAGLLLYPVAIVFADLYDLNTAGTLLSDIAPTYFVSVSGLTACFFGMQAYTKGK